MNIWLRMIGILVVLATSSGILQAQQAKVTDTILPPTAQMMITTPSLKMMKQDVDRLLKDLGQTQFESFLRVDAYRDYFDIDKPNVLIFYNGISGTLISGWKTDNQRFADSTELLENDPDWTPAKRFRPTKSKEHWPIKVGSHGIDLNEQILIAGNDKLLAQWQVFDWASLLDEGSQDLLNQCGLTAMGWVDEQFFNPAEGALAIPMTDQQQKFVADLIEVITDTQVGMMGLKYHDRVLETRLRAQLKKGTSFDSLFHTNLDAQNYRSDLGMVENNLVVAVAMRSEVARDSAATHLLPQLLLDQGGRTQRSWRWLSGSTLGVLTDLIGDSWMDLSAARVAVYRDVTEENGRYSILGIADSLDPQVVLKELERISILTSPTNQALGPAQQAEVDRLLEQLADGNGNESDRAETRLRLGGPRILDYLKQNREKLNPGTQQKLDRVILRIAAEAAVETKPLQVVDPEFWSRLRPGLELNRNTGKVAGFTKHTIKITPDPSKDKDKVKQAIRAMEQQLGTGWDEIQVVQVREHFVFLVGSNDVLLEEAVRLTDQGSGELTRRISNSGNPDKAGLLQTYAFLDALADELNHQGVPMRNFKDEPLSNRLSFASLTIEDGAIQLQALIPVESIDRYIQLLFGF